MHLTAIYIYPVKSLGGISLTEAVAEIRGLAHDRRWMLTNREGVFLSQREIPGMARLQPSLENDQLVIKHADGLAEPLVIPLDPASYGGHRTVTVWDSICDAVHVSDAADSWFTKVLQNECHLVYMPDSSLRRPDPEYAHAEDLVSFADGYPFLLLGEASIAHLNSKLDAPLGINRFRPNFVFAGGSPNAEDTWKSFTIGSVLFRGTKPCGRCEITTIDQETLVRGKEPLATLATYRRRKNNVVFGMNVCLDGAPGIVRVGEELVVIEKMVGGI